MAYGYRPRSSRRRSGSSRRPRSTRVRRRSTRKAPYRPRRVMTKRRIINITSRKKNDSMIPTRAAYDGTNAANGGATFSGASRQTIIFTPSTRDKQSGDPTASSTRETDRIFVRGFKESITLTSNSPASWRWRRVVFALKGFVDQLLPGLTAASGAQGYVRLIPDFSTAAATTSRNLLESILFRGAAGTDWQTVFTAKVDTQRVTLLSDKVRTLNSGNSNGRFFKHRQWYPINKTLLYGNDETGETENATQNSVLSKPGIGDIFVVDFFECASGNAADQLYFEPECTFYWHEK